MEDAHAVGDGLQPGERGPAVGEGLEHDIEATDRQQRAAATHGEGSLGGERVVHRQVAGQLVIDPHDEDQGHRSDEEIRRERERPPRLPQPAKVAIGEHGDDGDRDLQRIVAEVGQRGGQRIGARRRLHRHGDDVVEHERDRRDLCHDGPEVLPGDDIGPARAGVDHDDLAIGHRHDDEHREDDRGQRQQHVIGRHPEQRQHDQQHHLRAIGAGGDAVAGQHAQGEGLAELLVLDGVVGERLAEQGLLDLVAAVLGHLDAGGAFQRPRTGWCDG